MCILDAGEAAEIKVEARDDANRRRLSGGDFFTVKLEDTSGSDTPCSCSLQDQRDGQYTLTYTCHRAGAHQLHVHNGKHI